jgi:hypothetical protein
MITKGGSWAGETPASGGGDGASASRWLGVCTQNGLHDRACEHWQLAWRLHHQVALCQEPQAVEVMLSGSGGYMAWTTACSLPCEKLDTIDWNIEAA